tara:strand:- start:88 stop:399 length:312 start_codon:yes stop_codon:yes gene_type:complete
MKIILSTVRETPEVLAVSESLLWRLKGRTHISANIPMFPKGIGMVHFHERGENYSSRTGKYITPFNTHTHQYNTKGFFDSSEYLLNFLNEMIHECKKKKEKFL